jgi:hypothetical protein
MQIFDFTNVLLLEVQLFIITVWKSKKNHQVEMQTQARQYQLLTFGTFRFFIAKFYQNLFFFFLKTFRNTR